MPLLRPLMICAISMLEMANVLCVPAIAQPKGQNIVERTADLTPFQAKVQSEGKIVLHFGDGISLADEAAEVLNRHGYPAAAFSGGQKETITVYISMIKLENFDDRDAASGELIAAVEIQYGIIVEGRRPQTLPDALN